MFTVQSGTLPLEQHLNNTIIFDKHRNQHGISSQHDCAVSFKKLQISCAQTVLQNNIFQEILPLLIPDRFSMTSFISTKWTVSEMIKHFWTSTNSVWNNTSSYVSTVLHMHTNEECCARRRFQGHEQVIKSHSICGLWLLVPSLPLAPVSDTTLLKYRTTNPTGFDGASFHIKIILKLQVINTIIHT